MPQLKTLTIAVEDVRKDDVFMHNPVVGTRVEAVSSKVKWVTITLHGVTAPVKRERGTLVEVQRSFPTDDEKLESDRAYASKQLWEWLDANSSGLKRTMADLVERGEKGALYLGYSDMQNLVMGEALRNVADRLRRSTDSALKNDLTIVNAAVAYAERVYEQRRQYGPSNPFSRSSNIMSNLMDDAVRYAEDKFLDSIKWSVSPNLYAEAKAQNAALEERLSAS